jgi:hypothetical protein
MLGCIKLNTMESISSSYAGTMTTPQMMDQAKNSSASFADYCHK